MDFKPWTTEMGIRCPQVMRILNCSYAKASRILSLKRKPLEKDYRAFYLDSEGELTPNSFFPIAKWEKELAKQNSSPRSTVAKPE